MSSGNWIQTSVQNPTGPMITAIGHKLQPIKNNWQAFNFGMTNVKRDGIKQIDSLIR